MAARPLQPSEYEIQREVEALRDIRRRSSTPGALAIDPDLPNQSPPTSPTTLHRSAKSAFPIVDSQFASSSDHPGSPTDPSQPDQIPTNPSDDPFHLFWVPASLHPEIAPAEFRAFLKEHARSPPAESQDSTESAAPSSTLSSSPSLSRKRSMLSRQYKPTDHDDVEEENIVPIKRNRSLLYPFNSGPQLTISDLQKLEELAEEAQQSDDPSRLRNVLRRSLSLNISPSAIDLMDDLSDLGDEADAPIIVPPPSQILKRTARTRIRKPGLPGDGNGHRFGSSRRGAKTSTAPTERTSSEISSSDHGDLELLAPAMRRPAFSDESLQDMPRPESYSEETSIYDAYARSEEDEGSSTPVPVLPHPEPISPIVLSNEPPQLPPIISDTPPQPQPQPSPPPQTQTQQKEPQQQPPLHQPQPQRLLVPQTSREQLSSRTPSPGEASPERSAPAFPSNAPPPSQGRKQKDKKGLFGSWGSSDKGGKKASKDRDRENRDRATSEKDQPGFFGALFGKKKQDSEYQSSMAGGTSGREAAQALLGASKSSKSYVPPSSPGLAPGIGGNPYARYPIHVERAIYRLSHIKLANPRRPLYEQVLISNLMFWYLGVINKTQNSTSPTPPNGPQVTGSTTTETEAEKEEREREQMAREQREQAEKERRERERQEREQREREIEAKKKESSKRGSLTKPASIGSSGRRAEMPIKGPQYEMQHRVMAQEYVGYNPSRSPTSPSAPVNGGPPQQYPRSPPNQPQFVNGAPKIVSPQSKQQPDQAFYQSQPDGYLPRSGLPPGAMPPADQSTWMSTSQTSTSTQQRRISPNQNPRRRSGSPPPQLPQMSLNQPMQLYSLNSSQESLGERIVNSSRPPGRSLSATASTPNLPPTNGQVRKGNSAHAVAPYEKRPRTAEDRPNAAGQGEEEDVPLAVWQQQRRR